MLSIQVAMMMLSSVERPIKKMHLLRGSKDGGD